MFRGLERGFHLNVCPFMEPEKEAGVGNRLAGFTLIISDILREEHCLLNLTRTLSAVDSLDPPSFPNYI